MSETGSIAEALRAGGNKAVADSLLLRNRARRGSRTSRAVCKRSVCATQCRRAAEAAAGSLSAVRLERKVFSRHDAREFGVVIRSSAQKHG
jgi:hypothetical protein